MLFVFSYMDDFGLLIKYFQEFELRLNLDPIKEK
ncbi:hypothetical protein MED297_01450 [Reinekea sp. MED297]|uniref:Uncharacterized protein n=1 Tax=Reinekea blandensis MED297 TaxID=314283 RepID=A4BBW0_9GAMM|nr:hypothetical protein MED297_01450 [Reinekea sp. MED297] [Reinekea blandensis MED297]